MNRIPKNIKPRIHKPNKIKLQKPNPVIENTVKKGQNLEKSPSKDYFDFSTEEKGYFTRRDSKTNKILDVIYTRFPR